MLEPISFLDSANENVRQFLGRQDSESYGRRLRSYVNLPGAEEKLRMLVDAKGKDGVRDLLREVDTALLFTGLGFYVEVEPNSRTPVAKNIDLRISRGKHSCFLEITRFRPIYPGPLALQIEDLDDNGLLPEYGDIPRDIEKACQKIIKKFDQVGSEPTILAVWNDDQDMEEIEVGFAVEKIIQEEQFPSSLVFLLYVSDWIGQQQIYCYLFGKSLAPHLEVWIDELERSRVNVLIEKACQEL